MEIILGVKYQLYYVMCVTFFIFIDYQSRASYYSTNVEILFLASLNICILPPSVSHFEIECSYLIFVSPTLLDADWSLCEPIARSISHNWAGIMVTCANFEHLWLNKSFSMYICRRILQELHPGEKDKIEFICLREFNDKVNCKFR